MSGIAKDPNEVRYLANKENTRDGHLPVTGAYKKAVGDYHCRVTAEDAVTTGIYLPRSSNAQSNGRKGWTAWVRGYGYEW